MTPRCVLEHTRPRQISSRRPAAADRAGRPSRPGDPARPPVRDGPRGVADPAAGDAAHRPARPPGSRCATNRPWRRWRSAATGTTCCPIGDHDIGIIVGDCVGRGLPAAAVMGQLRSSARALLLTGAEPAVLLEELDSAAALIPHAYCATVFLAILDIRTGELRYSNAGHMPAVLAAPSSPPSVLSDAAAVPLAVRRAGAAPAGHPHAAAGFGAAAVHRRPGGTAGRGDRRRHRPRHPGAGRRTVLTRRHHRRRGAARDWRLPPDTTTTSPSWSTGGRPRRCTWRSPPRPLNLGQVRTELTAWLAEVGAGEELTTDVVLAVNEACTNSVEHGYRDVAAGVMIVDAAVWGDEIEVQGHRFRRLEDPRREAAHPRPRAADDAGGQRAGRPRGRRRPGRRSRWCSGSHLPDRGEYPHREQCRPRGRASRR